MPIDIPWGELFKVLTILLSCIGGLWAYNLKQWKLYTKTVKAHHIEIVSDKDERIAVLEGLLREREAEIRAFNEVTRQTLSDVASAMSSVSPAFDTTRGHITQEHKKSRRTTVLTADKTVRDLGGSPSHMIIDD